MTEHTNAVNSQSDDSSRFPRHNHLTLGMITKRSFDTLISIVGLMMLSPLFLFLAWRIKSDTPGPVLFRGPRLGRGGRVFQILKFRTMYEQPQSYAGPHITARDDQRITPLGKWLRDTKLNELPQLWNVLVGDMSLVGPRPEDPELSKVWPPEVLQEVLSVRPGITSPASVHYHNEENLLTAKPLINTYIEDILPNKLDMDVNYVRHYSLWLDLKTLYLTIMLLMIKLGILHTSEGTLLANQLNSTKENLDNILSNSPSENQYDPFLES